MGEVGGTGSTGTDQLASSVIAISTGYNFALASIVLETAGRIRIFFCIAFACLGNAYGSKKSISAMK